MKRFITFCLAALMALSLSVPTFAEPVEDADRTKSPEAAEKNIEDIQSKFDALSDSEKQELYDLAGEIAEARIDLIEKYRDLELIGESEAEEIIDMIQSKKEKAEADGRMPGGFRPRPHHELPETEEN